MANRKVKAIITWYLELDVAEDMVDMEIPNYLTVKPSDTYYVDIDHQSQVDVCWDTEKE